MPKLRESTTAVIVRGETWEGSFASEPFEAGWATEAVVFAQTEGDHPDLEISVEVSPDGIHWIRRAAATLAASAELVEVPLTSFGNWIRVVVTGAMSESTARVLVRLNLKG